MLITIYKCQLMTLMTEDFCKELSLKLHQFNRTDVTFPSVCIGWDGSYNFDHDV